jgi:hypothetical protein
LNLRRFAFSPLFLMLPPGIVAIAQISLPTPSATAKAQDPLDRETPQSSRFWRRVMLTTARGHRNISTFAMSPPAKG